MEVTTTRPPIADYCAAMDRKEIVVNRDYQRSDVVWPDAARSFLIETILMGYPVPKFYLYQKLDIATKSSVKEVVDGQQRSRAILDFFHDKFALSKRSQVYEAVGKRFSEMDEDLQSRFLNYPLSVDLFLDASPRDLRETFRRINSYTVPLNPSERRHATFQGEMKWFVFRLADRYDQNLIDMGVMSEKSIVRMLDTKLFAELIHAMLNGISTTKESHLDALYEQSDDVVPQKDVLQNRFETIFNAIVDWDDLHNSELMKPHLFYSLFLAAAHADKPIATLTDEVPVVRRKVELTSDRVVQRLSGAAEALATNNRNREWKDFVEASKSKTNVKTQRLIRVAKLYELICG